MTAREMGFLLLTSDLGYPGRKILTAAQFRALTHRVSAMERPTQKRELTCADLQALGYGREMAERILLLLSQRQLLENYLCEAERFGCIPVTRNTQRYPQRLREALGEDAPASLWCRGDCSLLETPKIALVGSRDLLHENKKFAEAVGMQAAKQGFTLVSGDARGADRTAQDACLYNGGSVISVVADSLISRRLREKNLYISENGYNYSFSAGRALSRNHVIHALGSKVFVAQCSLYKGGTWGGTYANLKHGRSPVFCFDDGTDASRALEKLGAKLISFEDLTTL